MLELCSIFLSAFAQDKAWINIHGGAVGCDRSNSEYEGRDNDIHSLFFTSFLFLLMG